MKTLGIIALVILLIIIIIAGSMQLKKRMKEEDESVADATETETTNYSTVNASGIKPVNVDMKYSKLKDWGKLMNQQSNH